MNISSFTLEQQSLIYLGERVVPSELWVYVCKLLECVFVLAVREGGDLDVLIASTVFCRMIDKGTAFIENILESVDWFTEEMIAHVIDIVRENSGGIYDNVSGHNSIESKIFHDALILLANETLYTNTANALPQSRFSLLHYLRQEYKTKFVRV